MSGRQPTAEQRRAIEAGGAEVLVEAGAGSGKTGVMVDRYCRLVCEEGVSPDSVLAFTFTDKAAAELRGRIRAEVARRAEQGSERAAGLVAGLGGAWVTTIHGFCHRVLSAHPVAVGLDPRFRVLDAAETERAAREAFDEALAEFLDPGEAQREETVAAFGADGLRGIVVAAHAELRSRGIAEPALPTPPPPDVEGALRRAALEAERARGGLKPGAPLEQLERASALLADPTALPGLDELDGARPSSKAKPLAAFCAAYDAAIAAVAERGEGGRAYAHLSELTALFSGRFSAAKDRRAGVDFEDLQILAARLLKGGELGESYRRRFRHLLVDEFQDTNRLQLRLIEALRGPDSELMVVGDELQSIYGFRHADLEVFRERREALEAERGGLLLPLAGNFRSRPEVIAAVNAIGEKLLGEDYTPLRVGCPPASPAPRGEGPPVEVLLTARDGWEGEDISLDPATDARTPPNQLAEARFVASRLRELADQGVGRGDMVVLLRAFTHLDAHEDSLGRAGLRPYVVGGRGYWSQQQVADVCALLATIANPLDDKALLGALASPACGVSPDTLWLLRAAAGRGRRIWPALERAAGAREDETVEESWLEAIGEGDAGLLREFVEHLGELRRRALREPLADLIDSAISVTGYDLAVLMRPAGEARFANVRKLMRLAAEFETAEGRDLRGLLDFLAARADADADAQAATAVEGHDGVRIMTVHSAKGLEFDVVALAGLSRGLLRPGAPPALMLGRELEEPRVGMQLRRLGARRIDLYAQRELCEEARRREAEEELRLFHVGATRARERLLLSGVVNPSPPSQPGDGTPVIERIVSGFGIDRSGDSTFSIPAPPPRPDLDASFSASEVAVRVSLPTAGRAAELTRLRHPGRAPAVPGSGPAPLVARRAPRAPNRPLSYTAIAAQGADPEEPLLESSALLEGEHAATDGIGRGRAVHSLLEWSHANGWQRPPDALLGRILRAAAGVGEPPVSEPAVLAPFDAWLGSDLFAERVRDEARSRSEVPIILEAAGTVLRGSIDLLIEPDGAPPLVVDYKSDALGSSSPAELAERYRLQQAIYALAVAGARGVERVEVAYVFLERAEDPQLAVWGPAELEAGRELIEERVAAVRAG